MKKKVRQYDFLKLFRILTCILVLLILVNFGLYRFSMSTIASQITRYADWVVHSNVSELQQTLTNIDGSMKSEIVDDEVLDEINNGVQKASDYQSIKKVKDRMTAWNTQYFVPVNHVIYLERPGMAIYGVSNNEDYITWEKIRPDLIAWITGTDVRSAGQNRARWNVVQLQGENFLLKYYRYKERFICCWIRVEDLAKALSAEEIGTRSMTVFSDSSGSAYNAADQLEEEKIILPENTGSVSRQKRIRDTMVISERVPGTSFCLNFVCIGFNQASGMMNAQIVMLLILAAVAGLTLFVLFYIWRTLIRPIREFSDNIQKMRDNENYTVETHYWLSELKNTSELLETLVNEINGLKIAIYERTLEQQKIMLDFLSLQIQPHFYLNCLNIIYSMAQMHQYEAIQKLISVISVYLRYIFKNANTFVTLEEEVGHIEKYLEISKIRYQNAFTYEITVDDRAAKATLPPLILQTFVENSLKHAITWDKDVRIGIHASVTEENHVLVIVEDNGPGFEPDVLEKLQKHENISEGEKRIGIMNAIARVEAVFGKEGDVHFENRKDGGARITIMIPWKPKAESPEETQQVFVERSASL